MELKNLLSVVIAALTALGAMLFAMGSQSAWLAMALWMAAVVSLVVTDFLGAVRVPRKLASLLMWGVLAIFLPQFLVQSNPDAKLQSVAGVLLCLQITLLFQEKDARVYGWLAVMSLLLTVVAARYSQGVVFGGLLIAYTIVGIFALSLLVLYSQWGQHGGGRVRPKNNFPVFLLGWLVAELAKPQLIRRRLGLRKLSHQPPPLNCGSYFSAGPRAGFGPPTPKGGLRPALLPASARWPLTAWKASFTQRRRVAAGREW